MKIYENVYDRIEKIATESGYFCHRFARELGYVKGREIAEKEIQYIHVINEDEMILSVFYDEDSSINIFFGGPNFEIYDTNNVERFSTDEQSIEELIGVAKNIINGKGIEDWWTR